MESPLENSSLFESFENRRKYPRLKMHLPVTVSGSGGEILKAYIYNISPDGIQIRYTVNDDADFFHVLTSSDKKEKSGKCNLRFDLGYTDTVTRVKIDAYPVYKESVDEGEIACGMFFSEKKLSENKKITDFLFYQLQVSFAELECAKESNNENSGEPVITARRTVIEDTRKSGIPEEIKGISDELNELIIQVGNSKSNLEPMKQLLLHILSSLKATQEIARHIDERISHIEHKLARRG